MVALDWIYLLLTFLIGQVPGSIGDMACLSDFWHAGSSFLSPCSFSNQLVESFFPYLLTDTHLRCWRKISINFPLCLFPSTYCTGPTTPVPGRRSSCLLDKERVGMADWLPARLVWVVYFEYLSLARSHCLLVYLKPALAPGLTFCPLLPLLLVSFWHSILVPVWLHVTKAFCPRHTAPSLCSPVVVLVHPMHQMLESSS